MKRHALLTVSAILLLLFHIQAQDIKLMSYNMQQPHGTNWEARVANAASIINTHQPDILGTQELHASMRNDLLSRTSGYASYGRSRECDWDGESSYILYKTSKYEIDEANSGNFWFKDDYWNCGRGYDPQYNRICTYVRLKDKATGKYFYVYNSHFPIPAYHTARVQSANLLMQQANSRAIKDPVIFTGDFNSTEAEGNPINYIKNGSALKMRDTYRDVHPTGFVTTGFGTRYDFIFLENKSSNSTLSSYVVDSPEASDHKPIVATVRLAVQAGAPVGQYIWLENQGKFVSSNYGYSPVTCDRPSVQGWEKFYVVDAGSGKIALRGSNNKYLSAETGYVPMNCDRPAYDDWEKFTWVAVSANQVALLGYNGKYVSSENGSVEGMNCNRPTYDGWEIFTWGVTSPPSARLASEELVETPAEISFYPNPCTDRLMFDNPEANVSVSIYNLSGQLVLDQSFDPGTHKIDVLDFNKGFYVAKVLRDDQVETIKFLKK